MTQPHDLMAGPPPTHLPTDTAQSDLDAGTAPADVVRRHPASPAAWAALATSAVDSGADDVTVYAYARVGYHRSLDLLALAARTIGEQDEFERCRDFLRDSSPAAYDALLAGRG